MRIVHTGVTGASKIPTRHWPSHAFSADRSTPPRRGARPESVASIRTDVLATYRARASTHGSLKGSDMTSIDPRYQHQQTPDQARLPASDGDATPVPGDDMRPMPLSPTAFAFLRQSLVRQQHRRHVFQARRLRVCMDGEERWPVDAAGDGDQSFHVPLRASCLEIFGDDAEGPLLLAVVPLSELAVMEANGAQHLSVTLEGDQTIAIDITLGEETDAEACAYVIQIAYTAPPVRATRGGSPR